MVSPSIFRSMVVHHVTDLAILNNIPVFDFNVDGITEYLMTKYPEIQFSSIPVEDRDEISWMHCRERAEPEFTED